jgi:hypothetical protein
MQQVNIAVFDRAACRGWAFNFPFSWQQLSYLPSVLQLSSLHEQVKHKSNIAVLTALLAGAGRSTNHSPGSSCVTRPACCSYPSLHEHVKHKSNIAVFGHTVYRGWAFNYPFSWQQLCYPPHVLQLSFFS